MKHVLTPAENSGIRGALRRWFARQPVIKEIRDAHRRTVPRYKKDGTRHKVDQVQHLCNVCKQWVPATIIEVDHIIPVIDVVIGFVNFDTFIERLVCDKSNLQIICDPCHEKKTAGESLTRRTIKYRAELGALTNEVMAAASMDKIQELKKRLSKYTAKSKPEEIRLTAQKLKEHLIREERD